jgi:hypothetical protein
MDMTGLLVDMWFWFERLAICMLYPQEVEDSMAFREGHRSLCLGQERKPTHFCLQVHACQ